MNRVNLLMLISVFAFWLVVPINAQAQPAFQVDDVWYEIVSDDYGPRAKVTCSPDGEKYSGEIVIAEKVKFDGFSDDGQIAVSEIGSLAFASCSNLTVHLPRTIHRIVPNAFEGSTGLTVDAADIASWCSMKFNTYDDARLEDLYGAKGIPFSDIDRFMIAGEEVVDLKIPEGVTKVSRNAFNSYSGLQSVEFASSVVSIDYGAFANCKNLKSVSTAGDGMKTVHGAAFEGCSNLMSVSLPSTVKEIENGAFQGCKSLTAFLWPASLTTVGGSAFKDCSSLTDADLTSTLVSAVNDYVFYGCTSLKTVDLTQVSTIGNYAFYGCADNLEIKLPEQCNKIGAYAFYGNKSFKALNLFAKNGIGERAFAKCTGLTQVSVGFTYGSEPGAFEDCTSLVSAVIQSGTESIPNLTFSGCTALTSVEIPEGVRSIGCAFVGCSSLEEITIPESVVSLSDSWDCDHLKSIHIKSLDSWMGMNNNTFSLKGGRKLLVNGNLVKEVVFPEGNGYNGYTTISDWFKDYEYLESITIPDKTVSIQNDAFNGCDNLSRIYCYAETPPHLSNYAFSDNCIQLATVYVPGHLLEAYRQDKPNPSYVDEQSLSWSKFRIEPIPDTDQKCATPVILYENGKLSFKCDTEGARFVSLITDSDMGSREDEEIDLTATYQISVYATAKNYINSDLVRAALCWIATEPQVTVVDNVAEVKAMPVIVEYSGGVLTVKGQQDGQDVTVYNIAGQNLGSVVSHDGVASLRIGHHRDILVVKIGRQTVKIR